METYKDKTHKQPRSMDFDHETDSTLLAQREQADDDPQIPHHTPTLPPPPNPA
jgi:hypothetical protein